jgi:hypothetical protein
VLTSNTIPGYSCEYLTNSFRYLRYQRPQASTQLQRSNRRRLQTTPKGRPGRDLAEYRREDGYTWEEFDDRNRCERIRGLDEIEEQKIYDCILDNTDMAIEGVFQTRMYEPVQERLEDGFND